MFLKPVLLLLVLHILFCLAASEDIGFTYHGFRSANLSLDGIADITSNGLLRLTNATLEEMGHAFFQSPITFKNSPNGSAFSFSTSFVLAIVPENGDSRGHGIVFVIAPTKGLPGALPKRYLGLFNQSSNGDSTNRVVGVELDTKESSSFSDINDNHVGVDINNLKSELSKPAGYYSKGKFHVLDLNSGQPIRVWVEYSGVRETIDVTLAPLDDDKPSTSILSLFYNISTILNEQMYIGFSSSTGSQLTSHYVLGWSFKINGKAKELDLSQLPKLPRAHEEKSELLIIGLPVIISITLIFLAISGLVYYLRRQRKYAQVLEDWELDYGPQRFSYKDLYSATKGFGEKELLGNGGFGRVYRGVLPTSKIEIAVKRVSHESRQGMREFVAEIVSIGRLRHRNLVPLLGYCRRKGELLLVYEYMSNGSLDNFLYGQPRFTLEWNQRFHIIKGVASGLFYLHEEWEQVVVHRDIKASNVMLDGEFNGRLGDFGLARLYDHGSGPRTTDAAGTLGYLAPDHARTGKATTSSDVYSFGAFLLEVACGRRPIERQATSENLVLADVVHSWWSKGEILKAVDPKLGIEYVPGEVELVLKLGLLCSHSEPTERPSMRQVVLYLEGNVTLPDLSILLGNSANDIRTFTNIEGFDNFAVPFSSLVAESILSGGL